MIFSHLVPHLLSGVKKYRNDQKVSKRYFRNATGNPGQGICLSIVTDKNLSENTLY